MPAAGGVQPPPSILWPVLGGIIVLAWATLWGLEQSSYAWLFHQHGGGHVHHAHQAGWLSASAFLAGWLLMTIAMMLPTTVPLVNLFRRMVAARPTAALLIGLLLTGYLAAWLAFGAAALALLRSFEAALASTAWLRSQAWIWGAGLFVLAGAFQFSALKYACLDRCRTPVGFLNSHWHGQREAVDSFTIGWRHGLFCVGCCWALMLLMFAVGTTSLAWMLVLALIMAAEKNMPWGRHLARPLGLLLVTIGVGLGLYNLAL